MVLGMNLQRLTVLAAIGICASWVLNAAERTAPAEEKARRESIAMRCAQAQLRLAEVTLEKAQAMNQKVAGTLVGSMVSQLADDVDYARVRVESIGPNGEVDYYKTCMQRAALSMRLAQARLQRAIEANKRVPGTVSDLDLERLRLGVEIAQLRIEGGRGMANASREEKLQWQIDMLNEELALIKQKTYLLGQNRYQF